MLRVAATGTAGHVAAPATSPAQPDPQNTAMLDTSDNVLLNASAQYDTGRNGLSLRGAVDNITGKQIVAAGVDLRQAIGFVEGYYTQSRRYWLTLADRP
nr:hypothetical protein TQ38_17885 [Novosphingobium sp. P6W]